MIDAAPPLVLGLTGDDPLELQLDKLLGSHACIIANSGGGKSGLLRKILEQSHGRVQHIVLDVEDEFYTLREKQEYVIAGGDGGDVPIALDTAGALARGALEHGFSLIVQLNELGADAPAYVASFLDGLMSAPRALWHPVLVTIDELQRFASRDAGDATPAIKDLMFRGRKRGFTGLFASLRMAEIDPGIRGMVNNWMLGRVGQALDRKTMAEQLGFSAREGRDNLAQIAERHFWAMGPALALEPRLFKVDPVETTPVHAGQAKLATPPAPDALRAILASLAFSAVPAPHVDDVIPADPAAALKKGGEVGRLLKERDDRIEALEAEIAGLRQQVLRHARRIEDEAKVLMEWVDDEGSDVESRAKAGAEAAAHEEAAAVEPVSRPAAGRSAAPPPPRSRRANPDAAGDLSGPQRRILDALGWWRALGIDAPSVPQLAFAARYSPRSTSFEKARGQLRTAGFVEYASPGTTTLTKTGASAATEPEGAVSRAELHRRVTELLTGPQRAILGALIPVWPEALDLESLASNAGYSPRSTSFEKARGQLRTLGLVDYPAPGSTRGHHRATLARCARTAFDRAEASAAPRRSPPAERRGRDARGEGAREDRHCRAHRARPGRAPRRARTVARPRTAPLSPPTAGAPDR